MYDTNHISTVAEEMKVPIYRIVSGQMKSDPETIKKALQDAFLMTKAWKGIILLDEADIFLERRSVNDLERNQLVSGIAITLSQKDSECD